MLKIIVLLVALALGALLGYAASRPDTFRVQRSTTIQAPPERIFALINDFRAWAGWSPYEQSDPAMTKTYSGASEGVGAVYAWAGNQKAGKGRMEILAASAPAALTIQLDFDAPFEAHNTAEFTLDATGDMTTVTWAMHGPQPFMMKVMGLVFGMDKLVGKDFETGLANMKALAEK